MSPGKGSYSLKRRVLAKLAQPHLKKFYRRVEADAANEGPILVHIHPPSSPPQRHAAERDAELTICDTC